MGKVVVLVALLGCFAKQVVGDFADAAVGGLAGNFLSGTFRPGAINEAIDDEPGVTLETDDPNIIGSLTRSCPCEAKPLKLDDIRGISDTWVNGGSSASNSFGLSNMVWAWGQFLDHDMVLSMEDIKGPTFNIKVGPRNMALHRTKTSGGTCGRIPTAQNGLIDAGNVYGTDKDFEKNILREQGSCRLVESASGFLPVAEKADDAGRFRFIAGDTRVDENAILTAMHTLWLREHNRLCDEMEKGVVTSTFSADRKYRIAKSVVAAKMQEITVREFLPALGISSTELQFGQTKGNSPESSVEFAAAAYRFGHTMIPDKVGSFQVAQLFDGQKFFLDRKPDGVTVKPNAESLLTNLFKAVASSKCAELDGKMSNALRNILFGAKFQEDLASRNIFRGRDVGLPSYGAIARCFGLTPDAKVEEETPDAWLGLLREPRKPGQPLGPTTKAILIDQFRRSLFGPRGKWWVQDMAADTIFFMQEIRSTTLAKVISANTGAKLGGNVFK